MAFNTWLPGDKYYAYNAGAIVTLENKATVGGSSILCQSFAIPDNASGIGITFDQVTPPFTITKPPIVAYASTSAMTLVVKDADGWLWAAPCPQQNTVIERGWSWDLFAPHSVQTNTVGTMPATPSPGVIQAFQFSGADGVHGAGNNVSQTISIAYLVARSPAKATTGTIRSIKLTNTNSHAHTWKIGSVSLVNGTRVPVKYIGALPFGLQANGPRNRLSPLPYKGPIVAGYQSGTPWIVSENNEKLAKMLEFMEDAQDQFTLRTPGVSGPWMHIYLQALWDCEQTGPIDTWVWDGPDGNPAWDGWQYRALDAMCRTWSEAQTNSNISADNKAALSRICTKFLDWLHSWLIANPTAVGVPNDWRPAGWTQGTPMTPNMVLEPKYTHVSSHDCALAIKGAIFSGIAGYNPTKVKYIVHRCIAALKTIQVKTNITEPAMVGAFTSNPEGFVVYGFEQGEILEALALAKQNPLFLTK